LFPGIAEAHILWILVVGVAATVLSAGGEKWYERARGIGNVAHVILDKTWRDTWRTPPISELPPAQISLLNRLWMIVLRGYLVVAAGMLIFKNSNKASRWRNGHRPTWMYSRGSTIYRPRCRGVGKIMNRNAKICCRSARL